MVVCQNGMARAFGRIGRFHMIRQLLWPFLLRLFSRDLGWYLSRYASCFALIAPRRFLQRQRQPVNRFQCRLTINISMSMSILYSYNNNNNNNNNNDNDKKIRNCQMDHINYWRTQRIHLSVSAVVNSPPKAKCGRLPQHL